MESNKGQEVRALGPEQARIARQIARLRENNVRYGLSYEQLDRLKDLEQEAIYEDVTEGMIWQARVDQQRG